MNKGPHSPGLLSVAAVCLVLTLFLFPHPVAAKDSSPGFMCYVFGFVLKPLGFCAPKVETPTPTSEVSSPQNTPPVTETNSPPAAPINTPVANNPPTESTSVPTPTKTVTVYVPTEKTPASVINNIYTEGVSESLVDKKIEETKSFVANILSAVRGGVVTAFIPANEDNILESATMNGETTFASSLLLLSGTPSQTSNRLYNNNSDLYWNGSILSSGASGNWTGSGSDVYRLTGKVGIGTTTPSAILSVAGTALFGGSSGTTTIEHNLSVLKYASFGTTTGLFLDTGGVVCNVEAYGAVGDNSRDNYAAITAAINACSPGGTVLFPMGVFRISQPLNLDKPITLQGTYAPRWYYASTPRSSIKPTTSFVGSAIIHVRDKSISGEAASNDGGRIRNISIDGNSYGTAIDGIYFEGLVRDWKVEDTDISQTSGDAFHTAQGAGTGNPRGFTVDHLSIYSPALHGVRATALTDSYLNDILVVGGAQRGFYFTSMGETKLSNSRAVFNTLEGLYIDGSSSNGGFQISGFSTDRNDRHGVRISATGTTTITFDGLLLRRDGANDGGGTETPYAGIAIIGSPTAKVAPVVITNLSEIPGVDDDGTGTPAPSVGIRVEKATYVSVNGQLWGVDQPYSNGGNNDRFIIAEDTLMKTGYNIVADSIFNDKWIATSSSLVYTAGNVGVGTTTPTSKLQVVGTDAAASVLTVTGATSQTADYFRIKSTYSQSVGDILTIDSTGSIGIGTTTMNRMINGASANSPGFRFTDTTNGAVIDMRVEDTQAFVGTMTNHDLRFITNQTSKAALTSGGKFGIASTSPWRFLSVTGTVGFDGLTAESTSGSALCLSSDKEVQVNSGAQTCTVSSARFKHDIQDFTPEEAATLAEKLRPVHFKYNGTEEDRIGLVAEEVGAVDGRLIFREEDGAPRGVRYEDLAVVLLGAFKHQQEQITSLIGSGVSAVGDTLKATFDTVLAKTIVVDNLHAKKIEADDEVSAGKQICVDGVCLTKEKLETLLRNANIGGASAPIHEPAPKEATTTESVTPDVTTTTSTSTPSAEEPDPAPEASTTPAE